ncbi:MAG: thioredoxin [Cypionkella sp.]|uniref:zinc-ribbon domain-containing protein n=1 Tax=Cypionkella sp. TaxID=2811411 RepID=UPI0026221642|nr:zinc-ribbon domain-containing protein [Cypionkella sp.]MDB5659583.1 thioredoxin [Cypionkella sp.]
MRLVCPNCDAEYEVDATAIPDGGRDVQCSNCGHAWFQLPPEQEAEMAAEEALFDAPPPVAALDVPDSDAEPDLSDSPPPPETDNEAVAPPPGREPMQRSIDESVLAVLREEAEREVQARKSEAPLRETPVIESQPDLGLDSPGLAGAAARRLARLKGEPEVASKPQTRREMLPEIEEINSTLRASSEKRAGGAGVVSQTIGDDAAKRSSFRSGFALVLVLAVIILVTYVMAPKLALQFPAAAGALQVYVASVDAARLWMDSMLKSAISFLHGLAGGRS